MTYDLSEEPWAVVERFLPRGWEESAREHGALTRAREIKDARVLLRLLLMHTSGRLSLKQTVVRAEEMGLVKVSAVALHKRLRVAEKWLNHLSTQLVQEMAKELGGLEAGSRRWRIIDATDIKEPGPKGACWRIHYSLRLPDLACDFFRLTDYRGAESFAQLPIEKNDVVLADRGYAKRSGVAHLLGAGANVLVRIAPQTFPLTSPDGGSFNLLPHLRRLKELECAEWPVAFEYQGQTHPVRLCAIKKSAVNTQRAQKKVRQKSQLNQYKTVSALAMELAGYNLVITTLPSNGHSAQQVLELYRCRWQVELAFKRLKSLLELSNLPKSDPDTCRSWLQGKILTALLIEKILRHGRFFSPWGFPL